MNDGALARGEKNKQCNTTVMKPVQVADHSFHHAVSHRFSDV